MSIVLTQRICSLEEKVDELTLEIQKLKSRHPQAPAPSDFERLLGEIKAIKMRMGKNKQE